MCSDREFCSKISKNLIFREKSGNRQKQEFFQIRHFLWYRFIDVKIHFLSKLFLKIIDFWESYVIFRFYRFTRTLTMIYKNHGGYLWEKSLNFWSKVARALKLCHSLPYMMHLKSESLRLSNIFLVCKTEYAEDDAILYPSLWIG